MKFVCPKCKSPFSLVDGGTARCENGHTFDRARKGYYNLLLGSVGGTHGDNGEMVRARRDFLNTGAYQPLADRVAELVALKTDTGTVIDMGCGEGYYTDTIQKRLSSREGVAVIGFDISKDAVARARGRNPNLELVVASAYKIPLPDGSVDTAVNMFSPLAIDETRRILKSGGTYVMTIVGENHLFSLKSHIYKTPYKNEVDDTYIDGFELAQKIRMSYNMTLDGNESVKNLFMMTPYAYRTGKEERERIEGLSHLSCEADFIILVYKRL